MRHAVTIVVQKASSSARSQGMPSKIIPDADVDRTLPFQLKRQTRLLYIITLYSIPDFNIQSLHKYRRVRRAAGLVFQLGRTSGWLSVVHNPTAAIANRQAIARLSCTGHGLWGVNWIRSLKEPDCHTSYIAMFQNCHRCLSFCILFPLKQEWYDGASDGQRNDACLAKQWTKLLNDWSYSSYPTITDKEHHPHLPSCFGAASLLSGRRQSPSNTWFWTAHVATDSDFQCPLIYPKIVQLGHNTSLV